MWYILIATYIQNIQTGITGYLGNSGPGEEMPRTGEVAPQPLNYETAQTLVNGTIEETQLGNLAGGFAVLQQVTFTLFKGLAFTQSDRGSQWRQLFIKY